MPLCPRTEIRKPAIYSKKGVCVSHSGISSQIGADILAAGGNAFDAAVAVSFAMGVVEPWMSGIGGGGTMVLRDAEAGEVYTIDFGMRAPKALDLNTYVLEDGYIQELFPWRKVRDDLNVTGIHAVAVPGLVAGLGLMHERFGKMPWRDLIRPATDLARAGLSMDWYEAAVIGMSASRIATDPALSAMFLHDGGSPGFAQLSPRAPKRKMPQLADTFDALGDQGWESFYRGDVANLLAKELGTAGASLSAADLETYKATLAPAVTTGLGNATVHLSPGLSAGKTLARTLALMPDVSPQMGPWNAALASALFQAQEERWEQDGAGALGDKPADCTTHFATGDGAGNLVSVTQTLLSLFGACKLLPESGVMLNNGLLWFDPEPNQPNSLAPDRPCLMNVCPAILQQSDKFTALGGAGGRRILSAVAHIAGYLECFGDDVETAIHRPRVDCSISGVLTHPPSLAGAFDPATLEGITLLEEPHGPLPLTYAVTSALQTGPDGTVGVADQVMPWADAIAPPN